MNLSKLLLAFLLILCYGLTPATANKDIIKGVIIDQKTKEPIPNVEVFITSTSLGCISGLDGSFELKTPYLPCKIVLMHLGYKPVIRPIKTNEVLCIELQQQTHALNEVSVSGKDRRKRNLRLFYKYFLWNTDLNSIKVLNDSVLKFKRDEMDFHASCETPLLVYNKHLGYELKIVIEDFHIYKKRLSNNKKVKLSTLSGSPLYQLKGFYYYKEVNEGSQHKQSKIDRNRRKQYNGSLRHFLSSLYSDKTRLNGFIAENPNDSAMQAIALVMEENGIKKYQFLSKEIQITYIHDELGEPINLDSQFTYYKYAKSKIFSSGDHFEIRSNGTSPDLPFELIGAMGQRSPVNSLPSNYAPNPTLVNDKPIQ